MPCGSNSFSFSMLSTPKKDELYCFEMTGFVFTKVVRYKLRREVGEKKMTRKGKQCEMVKVMMIHFR